MCYKHFINIENISLKDDINSLITEVKKFSKKKKIKIQYESKEAQLDLSKYKKENNTKSNKDTNTDLFELIHYSEAFNESGNLFNWENSIKNKKNINSIRYDFINEDLLIKKEYTNYYKKWLLFIKSEENKQFQSENNFSNLYKNANAKNISDFKSYEIIDTIITELDLKISIGIYANEKTEENLNFLMGKNFLPTKFLEKGIPINQEKIKKFILFDEKNNNFYNALFHSLIKKPENFYVINLIILKIYLPKEILLDTKKNFPKKILIKKKLNYQNYVPRIYRGNLYNFVFNENLKKENLRKLIITEEIKPEKIEKNEEKIFHEILREKFFAECKELNMDQKKALGIILKSKNFCTIEGYPGTGKTFLIVLAIRILIANGKKVLLTSFTNQAVDNVLERLKGFGVQHVFRIGDENKIPGNLKEFYVSKKEVPKGYESWNDFFSKLNVIGCTSIGIYNSLISEVDFDYCFIDEAGQLTEYNLLGPIMVAKCFIMIGDPNQVNLNLNLV